MLMRVGGSEECVDCWPADNQYLEIDQFVQVHIFGAIHSIFCSLLQG